MELYSRNISPFAARVRVSILAKNLPIRVIDSPDVSSAEFGELNPLRRVPVLKLDDGRTLPESELIVEYLEDTYPQIALRPDDPVDRARVRLISRVAELYVFPAVLPIFGARAAGDAQQLDRLFAQIDGALQTLESFMDSRSQTWHAFGNRFTTADGALAPFLFYVVMVAGSCGRQPFARHTRLAKFWEGAQADASLAVVIKQIAEAMAAAQRAAAAA